MVPTIVISQVLQDLKNGLTRTTTSPGYDPEIGSIQEKYNLNKTQVKSLFEHPQLFKKRTTFKKDLGFIIEDDVTPGTEVTDNVNTSVEVSEVESLDGIEANDTNVIETQIVAEEVLEERPVLDTNPFSFD